MNSYIAPRAPFLALAPMAKSTAPSPSGRWEDALVHARRALAIKEQRLGPEHGDLASTLTDLGRIEIHLHRFAEARQAIERGMAIVRNADGGKHPRLADLFEESAAMWQELGTPNAGAALPFEGLGELLLGERRSAEAVWAYGRAVAIDEQKLPPTHAELARMRFGLARALWEVGRERPRALALAGQAQASCEASSHGCDRAAIDAWLARRR